MMQGLSQGEGPQLDLLGDQMMLAVAFYRSGFNTYLVVDDQVRGKKVSCGDIFEKKGNRWFMVFDSMPGHLAIKAIGLDGQGLYLETAPLNIEEVRDLLVEKKLPFYYQAQPKSFRSSQTRKAVVDLFGGRIPKGLEPRIGWSFLWNQLDCEVEDFIYLADAIYTADAYSMRQLEAPASDTPMDQVKTMELRLQLSLRQTLQIEQRPTIITDIRPELAQLQLLFAIQHRVLKMSPAELEAYVFRDRSPEALRMRLKEMTFVLAGRFKSQHPNLSWREARAQARAAVQVRPA